MQAITIRNTIPPASRGVTMAHKIDLGFHHHNLLVTANPAAADYSPHRASSGALLAQPNSSMLTCTVRTPRGSEVVMRCLPAEDGGAFDPSGNKGLEGALDLSGTEASDAIIGDDYSNLSDDAAHQRISGSGADPSQAGSGDVNSMAQAIKAQIPKGPLAHDAALCEKVPGKEVLAACQNSCSSV